MPQDKKLSGVAASAKLRLLTNSSNLWSPSTVVISESDKVTMHEIQVVY